MDPPARIEWLQALRGAAVLMVLAFHAHADLLVRMPALAPPSDVAHGSAGGVEVFLAISGFLLVRSAARARLAGRLGESLARRVLRVYLGWWPVLLVLALASLSMPGLHLLAGSDPVVAILQVPGLFPAQWLSVVLAGAIVGIASESWGRRGMALDPPVYLIAGGLAILAANLGGNAAGDSAAWRTVAFATMATGALVACLALEQSPFRPPSWLVRVGDASYGLFLLHVPLLALFHAGIDAARATASPSSPGWWLAEAAVPALVVVVALGWYRWVERPLYRAGLRVLPRVIGLARFGHRSASVS